MNTEPKGFKGARGNWYIAGTGDIVSDKEVEGDIICEAPQTWENSMKLWKANAALIAQSKRMAVVLQELIEAREKPMGREQIERLFTKASEILKDAIK